MSPSFSSASSPGSLVLRKRQFRQRRRSVSDSEYSHSENQKLRKAGGSRKERKRRRSRSVSSLSYSESSPERHRKVGKSVFAILF